MRHPHEAGHGLPGLKIPARSVRRDQEQVALDVWHRREYERIPGGKDRGAIGSQMGPETVKYLTSHPIGDEDGHPAPACNRFSRF
jgi:hypothetical protein